MREMPIEQLLKWYKGNEVWALAVVKPKDDSNSAHIPTQIQDILTKYSDVFATPKELPLARPYDHADRKSVV